jgi:hypothetical protein
MNQHDKTTLSAGRLLTRDAFRVAVFTRDGYKCVKCGAPAVDAHHIMERRLFENGGYYENNGASLCEVHHLEAEQTILTPDEIRTAAGIKVVILPEHLYGDSDLCYDKWGNIVQPNGTRVKGELFFDESVQKVLSKGGVLELFSKYVKYPRTYHLPYSQSVGKDDRRLGDDLCFQGRQVVCTLKMDGENTSLYRDYIHARSLDMAPHASRNWVKGLWSRICHEIPDGWRICGENLYGTHTIKYTDLSSFFQVFSIWNDKNMCLSWDETVEWCELLNLTMVPPLYQGEYDHKSIMRAYESHAKSHVAEGFVVRTHDGFSYGAFRKSVAKFVHAGFKVRHGQRTSGNIEVNLLADGGRW